jgi:hypothetical protein
MLSLESRFVLPQHLYEDIRRFCSSVEKELPNEDFFRAAGLPGMKAENLLKILKTSFICND